MHKARLGRLEWVFARRPVYFITTCTANRRSLLATPPVHEAFRRFAMEATQHGVFVGRYVLTPDHLHLFAALAEDAPTLSAWIKSLKNSLSKQLRAVNEPSPHWQKGFFDHVLRSAESYGEKWQYVEQNPIRKGLVARASDWPHQGEIHPLELLEL